MHEVDMTKCLLLSLQEWKLQHAPRVPVVEVVHLVRVEVLEDFVQDPLILFAEIQVIQL